MSTRISPGGRVEDPVGIETAIARGMPPDGGLYVPTSLPALPGRVFDPGPLSYTDLATLILSPFFPGWENGSLRAVLEKAYGSGGSSAYFDMPEIAPLVPLLGLALPGDEERDGRADEECPEGRHDGLDCFPAGGNPPIYLLELFHGRTCAFKDMALSVLGGFLRESLDRLGRKEPLLVLTATSGDTGSAALEGLSAVKGIHAAVFYPLKGTSEIQRLQMTTVGAEGRFVAGIEGNFDDAQSAVKNVFARASRGEGALAGFSLSSANSINIGRLLPQIVYYVAAWRALAARGALGADRLMHVSVPTGNFGDILAAKYAKEMGLPIGRLVCASNANKVLADFFSTGIYDRRRELMKTESPSMDILVSSNLERLLFMASGRSQKRVSSLMGELASRGWFEINAAEKAYIADFSSGWCSDPSAKAAIANVWDSCSLLVDPHTATAVEVAIRTSSSLKPEAPIVVASTASPFKFPRACIEALNGASMDNGGTQPPADGDWEGVGEEPPRTGDFALAERLSTMTGRPMPGAIRALRSKAVTHDTKLPISEVENALARYAREKMGARP
ncbi:MAG TPA: threonine synthase [Rectinemataceae bacterium]|nr:threonine synthase [Rectinemataceae bacterium]